MSMMRIKTKKKRFRRGVALLLAFLLAANGLFLLTACGKTTEETSSSSSETTQTPVTTNTPTTDTPISEPVMTTERPGFVDTPVQGVFVEYYNGKALEQYVTSAVAETVGGVWAGGANPADGVNSGNYSILFSGRIRAPFTGRVTFTTAADDGVILTVDGQTLICDEGPHYTERHVGSLDMVADQLYDFSVEYYNGELGGDLAIFWSYGDVVDDSIPAEALFLPKYPVRLAFSYTDSTETVIATMTSASSESYTLLLEGRDSSGQLLQSQKTERPQGAAYWEASMAIDERTERFSAYVLDQAGNTVSLVGERLHKEDIRLTVDADEKTGTVSELLYGACMEDVNHELYGGIWSQMIFGESFEEETISEGRAGFTPIDGSWNTTEENGERILTVANTANGPKLLLDSTVCTEGSFSADVYVDGEGAGFLVKTAHAAVGADSFDGYEISLFHNMVRVAEHRYDYTNIKDTPCAAPLRTWVKLKVAVSADTLTVWVNGREVFRYTDPSPLESGAFGFRSWNASAKYKNIQVSCGSSLEEELTIPDLSSVNESAGMWKAEVKGNVGMTSVITTGVYSGKQSQRLCFLEGNGSVSVNNMGLNRMGMRLVAGKDYNGYFYAKSAEGVRVYLALENADGSRRYAESAVEVKGQTYQKYSFSLTPDSDDETGRFVIEIRAKGTLDVGYVFLEPGEWGLYKGLHVRRDVGELLEEQGLRVLRFGGCMANASDWKWKNMTGAPETREAYKGWWYTHSSYGFGIIEFLDLCEALGVVAIPDFSSYETADDMQDFIRFALGTDPDDEWVKLRRSMGREEPYNLSYLQIGNEDKIDAAFAMRFNRLADAIWEYNDTLTLIVGDFEYKNVITDPYRITGATSGITTLANHKKILDNAAEHGRRVLFDIHFWSESGNDPLAFFAPAVSFYEALKALSPEADTALCVLELNANAHDFERALCNAVAINHAERMSDIFSIVCSANALQVDKQNDNGWNQGLIFMDNSGAWYQAPAYVDRMFGAVYLPYTAAYTASESVNTGRLDVTVTVSEDGKCVAVKIVNRSGEKLGIGVAIPAMEKAEQTRVTMAGALKTTNTTDNKTAIAPESALVSEVSLKDSVSLVSVDEYSVTTLLFQAK